MRARTALRVVALVSTLAGSAALPLPAAAATTTTKKSSSKTTKKSASKSSSKSSGSKSAEQQEQEPRRRRRRAPPPRPRAVQELLHLLLQGGLRPGGRLPFHPRRPRHRCRCAEHPAPRGPTRIDFDDRLIQGQTNKSGSVYLYDRKELKQSSMVKKRESFREEIVGVVYDSEL